MRSPISVVLLALSACAAGPRAEGDWSIDAEIVESCCCAAICPCLVGSPSTLGHCDGNRLITIDRGYFGGVNLDGVRLVLVFNVRKWSKLYVSDKATDEQFVAVRKLMEAQRGWTYDNVLEAKRVALTHTRTASMIRFSVPAADTEIELMKGEDGGPIKVDNLPSRFRQYVQYKSKVLTHTSAGEGKGFEYSGTNGFRARYVAAN